MHQNSQHDSPTKNCFIGAVQAGQTISQAAHKNGIAQQAGSDLWQKFQETGSTTNHHQSGHPKKLTSVTVSKVVHDSKKNH
jgi:transposase